MKRFFILLLIPSAFILVGVTYTDDHAEIIKSQSVTKDIVSHISTSEIYDSAQTQNVTTKIIDPQKPSKPKIVHSVVERGDSFNDILMGLQVEKKKIKIINQEIQKVFDLTQFRVGNSYSTFYGEEENLPCKLVYEISLISELTINLKENSVYVYKKPIKTTIKNKQVVIKSSLIQSLKAVKVPEDLADKLLSIFVWEIDFKNLQRGDYLNVIYEEKTIDGQAVGSGDILAAKFIHRSKEFSGYQFDNGYGYEYFDENGTNLSHAPLHFEIVSSLYNKKRLHPVRKTYRAHLGMDFMADEGTEVIAIKAGTILEAGYRKANGIYVKIKHDNTISTQYLHLSKIDSSIVKGAIVKQGQKIGEVGSTGLSSGPHLCFRVWRNGIQIDPLKYNFLYRDGVRSELMSDFKQMVSKNNAILISQNLIL